MFRLRLHQNTILEFTVPKDEACKDVGIFVDDILFTNMNMCMF